MKSAFEWLAVFLGCAYVLGTLVGTAPIMWVLVPATVIGYFIESYVKEDLGEVILGLCLFAFIAGLVTLGFEFIKYLIAHGDNYYGISNIWRNFIEDPGPRKAINLGVIIPTLIVTPFALKDVSWSKQKKDT